MTKDKNNAGKLVLILILLIAVAAGVGGFYGYKAFFSDPGPDYKMVNVRLTDETIAFLYKSIPAVYQRLSDLNLEIRTIDLEMKRLDGIEKEYPKQKKIVAAEKKVWKELRKQLQTALEGLEQSVEVVFVAYSVNPEKEQEVLESKNEEILSATTEILETTRQQTARLKPKKKGWLEQLKEKFSG